jgi:endonuclease/exonuclease/phosphatase family metal-dependent hydrolase
MTYNIRSGRGCDDRIDLGRIAAVIGSFEPDLVALQEVDAGLARSGSVDQAADLAGRLAMEVRFAPTVERGEERYGIATLARLPIEDTATRCLPHRGGRRSEPRSALVTRVAWTAADGVRWLDLVNTHLSVLRGERPAQVAALACGAGAVDLVLAGDLNCTARSAVFRTLCCGLSAATRGARSWPARLPLVQLDHILYRGALEVVRSGPWTAAGARRASDHLPVVAEFAAARASA